MCIPCVNIGSTFRDLHRMSTIAVYDKNKQGQLLCDTVFEMEEINRIELYRLFNNFEKEYKEK